MNFGEIHEGILLETKSNVKEILIDHPKKVALKKLKRNENKIDFYKEAIAHLQTGLCGRCVFGISFSQTCIY